FCEEESMWLNDYAFFRILMEENDDGPAWNRWPAQFQSMERARNWLSDLPQDRQRVIKDRQNFFCYVQWIAYHQWREIKSYAESRDIALMGDIPFGVSYHSADVFTRRNEFMLEQTGGRAPHFIPRDDQTPENCEASKRDGEEYLRIVLEEAGSTCVIGEDLGMVPGYMRPDLRSLGIAGFKIPQWEVRDGAITPGDKYERLSVATYAT